VCGHAGGFPVEPVNGNPVYQLGVNLADVAEKIAKAFLPDRPVGAGYFRLAEDVASRFKDRGEFGVLFFLVQNVRHEFGKVAEEQLEIKAYVVEDQSGATELSSKECASLIRGVAEASRLREPHQVNLEAKLKEVEAEIALMLRRSTDEDIRNQVRRVVWPLGSRISRGSWACKIGESRTFPASGCYYPIRPA
jgi:hypothetical protein